MTNIEITNLAIAVYGAVVATASIVLSVILAVVEWRRSRPQLKVRTSTLQTFTNGTHKVLGRYFSVNIANMGTRPITITSHGFLDRRGHRLVVPDYLPSPFTLEDGQSKDLPYPVSTLADKSFLNQVISVWVTDSTGKSWTTKIPSGHKQWILDMAREEKMAR